MSEAKKGKKLSISHKNKLSEAHKGILHTEESKRKISEANKGKKRTSEQVQRMIKNHANVNGIKNPRCKKVICLNTGEVFNYIKLAAEKYSVFSGSISNCCSGKLKSAGKIDGEKLRWSYY